MQLPQAGGVSAGELGASHPAYHPVAADLNQLASGVRPRHLQPVIARVLPNPERPISMLLQTLSALAMTCSRQKFSAARGADIRHAEVLEMVECLSLAGG